MTLEEVIRQVLRDSPAVTALVGERIYPDRAPQGVTGPLIIYRRISTTRPRGVNRRLSVAEARVQVDCWVEDKAGETPKATALELSEAVRLAIETAPRFVGPVEILGRSTDNEWSDWDEDAQSYRQSLDFMLTHRES